MKKGYYGDFGGQFVPELLMPPLLELEEAMRTIVPSAGFQNELNALLADYVGRPSPLYRCPNLSKELGFDLWLKREDLNHTGAHKINNTMGQGLLTKHMGKSVLLAETGAGQHGVATATAAAMLGLGCIVYMGAEDVVRQAHILEKTQRKQRANGGCALFVVVLVTHAHGHGCENGTRLHTLQTFDTNILNFKRLQRPRGLRSQNHSS